MSDLFQKPANSYDPRGRLDPAGFQRNVAFTTYPPPADLAPFVEHGWSIRWDTAADTYFSEEVMHRPYVDLFVSAEQAGVQGTFRGKRTYVAAGRGRIIGLRFRPGAFHAVWAGALADLQDEVIELARVFPVADAAYVASLLALEDAEAVAELFDLVRLNQPQPDANIELINAIIAAVETDETLQTVGAVARAFSRSERGLQQLFQDYVGLGLKWQLQRHKLLAAAAIIRATAKPDWAALAYDLGYSSQPHFITDFKRVLGKTPRQYQRAVGKG